MRLSAAYLVKSYTLGRVDLDFPVTVLPIIDSICCLSFLWAGEGSSYCISLENLWNPLSCSWQSMIRIFKLRRYNGSFAYIPAPGNVGTGGPCSGEHEVSQLLQNAEIDSDRSWRKSGYSGPLQTPSSSEWRAMDGAFVLVWLNNVPFTGEHIMSAPNAKVLCCPLCCLGLFTPSSLLLNMVSR